ncbi:hypothetical protein SCHPADRAFT_892459 [Schizopora paradoxa]|uniref:Uncharacterized protein n=1 Tax=Schizopora paradoxa TaxID=27342 RepID=A0A0H2REL0_9AGAM|nr:hypothetical protein SCHPADRAFT_892459 [Schizopora paradoxa]
MSPHVEDVNSSSNDDGRPSSSSSTTPQIPRLHGLSNDAVDITTSLSALFERCGFATFSILHRPPRAHLDLVDTLSSLERLELRLDPTDSTIGLGAEEFGLWVERIAERGIGGIVKIPSSVYNAPPPPPPTKNSYVLNVTCSPPIPFTQPSTRPQIRSLWTAVSMDEAWPAPPSTKSTPSFEPVDWLEYYTEFEKDYWSAKAKSQSVQPTMNQRYVQRQAFAKSGQERARLWNSCEIYETIFNEFTDIWHLCPGLFDGHTAPNRRWVGTDEHLKDGYSFAEYHLRPYLDHPRWLAKHPPSSPVPLLPPPGKALRFKQNRGLDLASSTSRAVSRTYHGHALDSRSDLIRGLAGSMEGRVVLTTGSLAVLPYATSTMNHAQTPVHLNALVALLRECVIDASTACHAPLRASAFDASTAGHPLRENPLAASTVCLAPDRAIVLVTSTPGLARAIVTSSAGPAPSHASALGAPTADPVETAGQDEHYPVAQAPLEQPHLDLVEDVQMGAGGQAALLPHYDPLLEHMYFRYGFTYPEEGPPYPDSETWQGSLSDDEFRALISKVRYLEAEFADTSLRRALYHFTEALILQHHPPVALWDLQHQNARRLDSNAARVVVEVISPDSYFRLRSGDENHIWHLVISDLLTAVECLRRELLSTHDMINFFLRRGTPFAIAYEGLPNSLPIPPDIFPSIPLGFQPSPADFEIWETKARGFLDSQRGHLVWKMGGIYWRIALYLRGTVPDAQDLVAQDVGTIQQAVTSSLFEEAITGTELGVLIGMVEIKDELHPKKERMLVSYFPTFKAAEGTPVFDGMWTPCNEEWFLGHLDSLRHGTVGLLSQNQWRKVLHSPGVMHPAHRKLEKYYHEVAEDLLDIYWDCPEEALLDYRIRHQLQDVICADTISLEDKAVFIKVDGDVKPFCATGHYPVLAFLSDHQPSRPSYIARVLKKRYPFCSYSYTHVEDGASSVTYRREEEDSCGRVIKITEERTSKFDVLVLRYDPVDYRCVQIDGELKDPTGPLGWVNVYTAAEVKVSDFFWIGSRGTKDSLALRYSFVGHSFTLCRIFFTLPVVKITRPLVLQQR